MIWLLKSQANSLMDSPAPTPPRAVMNRAVLGEHPEVIPQVGMQNCQNEDRLFPLIKEGFRGLSFFLVDRRLQPP
jgi:hypothetical protein